MKRLVTIITLLISALTLSAENENRLISEIIADIEKYKNSEITVNLRLKYLDRVFEKIVFYDLDNVDIEFDISGKAKRKELSDDLINIHEGMVYSVRFTVIGAGGLGALTGELHEFMPVILEKIPIE